MQLDTWLSANIQPFTSLCMVEAAALELDLGWKGKSHIRIRKPFFLGVCVVWNQEF